MKKTFLLFTTICLLTGCMDMNDTTQPVTATIQLLAPDGFSNMNDMAGMTVTLQSETETATAVTDASGKAVFSDLAPDVYDISVATELTAEQYKAYTGMTPDSKQHFTLTGTLNQQTMSHDTHVSLPLTVFLKQSLIIGKVYPSNSRGNTAYSAGKYIELYNNSDEEVDAAGLYIGLLESNSTIAYQVYPYEQAATPGILHLKQVFRIPETTPVIVAPGGTLLLVNSATNHSTQNDYERDLTGADFEAKDINKKVPNNENVPALLQVYTNMSNVSNMNITQGGPSSLVIFRTGEDVTSWPTVYADGKTSGTLFLAMPASYVLDGVDILKNKAQTGVDINSKRLFQDIDAGYTNVESTTGTTGERLVRKTASITSDGRKVLQDTNNSTNDFVCNDNINPREYLEP